jgi:MEMO1 family protein
MVVYGLISPHPPIILPEVGGKELGKVRRTIEALEQAVADLARSKPEKLIIISPHEGHGFDVPIHFLGQQLPGEVELEEILVTEPSYQYYYDYGRRIGRETGQTRRRVAVVASGDLSHVLKADGPYGYQAEGPVLDKLIVEAVRRGDAQALLGIDPAVLDKGAECGLRSILFLLGALDGLEATPEVLSYEGPFGVGYLVAKFTPGSPCIVELARAAIEHFLATGRSLSTPRGHSNALGRPAGAFVSLHQPDGALRGCIGTTVPTKKTLAAEVIANAVAAATRDPRFPPVSIAELERLRISVDVLGEPVPEPDPRRLDPKRYGLIVSASGGRHGVLLPDIDGVETVAEQIAICHEKAGIGPGEPVEMAKFEVKRFEEA